MDAALQSAAPSSIQAAAVPAPKVPSHCVSGAVSPPPKVARVAQSKLAERLKVAADTELHSKALAALQLDKYAGSGRRARDNCWRTWCLFHERLFKDEPPLPLTIKKIESIVAVFKSASYVSVGNYVHRARQEHIATAKECIVVY